MKQLIQFIELKSHYKVLGHGRYIQNPEMREFKARLSSYAGTTHCVSASSGTGTLLIAMIALDELLAA